MSRPFTLPVMAVLAALLQSAPAPTWAADAPQAEAQQAQVRIENVHVLLSQAGPVVLLEARNRAIPVFVDAVVAESIDAALSGRRPARPLSHDLMHNILQAFEGRVTQVVVTLKDRIYYAALTVVLGNTTRVFDSRSSDAIALAIHFKAPIFVNQALLDDSGVELSKPEGVPL
jgi:uncharacterized protein